MEIEIAVILSIVVVFVTILSYKVFTKYNTTELEKEKLRHKTEENTKLIELQATNAKYLSNWTSASNRIKKLRENYDIDYNKIDLDEDFEDESDEFKLSDLAKTIYPKLPPSLGKLIDKEEFHNAIAKTVEKQPNLLNTFIDKFISKPEEKATPQQVIQSEYL